MKIRTLLAVTLGLGAFSALAQQFPGDPGGPPHRHHPVPPIMAALDANKDGELDAAEIANASAALKTLDKNGDGKLTIDELLLPPPGGGTNQFRLAPPPGAKPPLPPIIAVLDANGDGELDANEIANASAALKTLDRNGDGKLTIDELLLPPKPPVPPLMAVLDANGDGELDAAEIANASAALLKLDTNGDGKLSREELRPKWPGGPGHLVHPNQPEEQR